MQPGGTEAADKAGISAAHGRAVHRTDKSLLAGESGERLLKDRRSPNRANYLETGYPPLHALRIITFISSRIASLSLQQNIRKRTKVRVQQRHSPCSKSAGGAPQIFNLRRAVPGFAGNNFAGGKVQTIDKPPEGYGEAGGSPHLQSSLAACTSDLHFSGTYACICGEK